MNSNDKNYWNDFYNTEKSHTVCCSNFCDFIIDFFKNDTNILNIIDCGCGNGRDSYKLSEKYTVDAVDNCGFIPHSDKNINFYCDDFISIDKQKYQLVYSRFTFHSITNEQQINFLKSIHTHTYLVIETRSDKGEKDEVFHGKTHFRNYSNLDYLKKIIHENGFEIIYIKEGNNMAKYRNENPICIRIICKKIV
tara:strand:+ start:735 stop:1316 length:582 start_codon:yes stop_codon:yes gene_type:complete